MFIVGGAVVELGNDLFLALSVCRKLKFVRYVGEGGSIVIGQIHLFDKDKFSILKMTNRAYL